MPSSFTHAGSSLPALLVPTSQLIALSSNSAKTTWIIVLFGSFHSSFLDASLQLSWTPLPDVIATQSCVFSPLLAPLSLLSHTLLSQGAPPIFLLVFSGSVRTPHQLHGKRFPKMPASVSGHHTHAFRPSSGTDAN